MTMHSFIRSSAAQDASANRLTRRLLRQYLQLQEWRATQRCLPADARIQRHPQRREVEPLHSRHNAAQRYLERGAAAGLERRQNGSETSEPQKENGGCMVACTVAVSKNGGAFEVLNACDIRPSWFRHISYKMNKCAS